MYSPGGYPDITRDGFPHSEIPGLRVVCTYPRLIAAYHVLHRLLVPRHPPCALSNLILILSILSDTPKFSYKWRCPHFDSLWSCQRPNSSPLIEPGREWIFLCKSFSIIWWRISRRMLSLTIWIQTQFHLFLLEITGIEPVTFGLQSRRSPNWAISPWIFSFVLL